MITFKLAKPLLTHRVTGSLSWKNSVKLLGSVKPNIFTSKSISVYTSNRKNDDDKITTTSIFVQDGFSIQELPCVVQIVNEEFAIALNGKTHHQHISESLGIKDKNAKNLYKNVNFQAEQEMILGFMRCSNVTDVFNLLDMCPEKEVNPVVALAVMRRIFDLENNVDYKNQLVDLLDQYSDDHRFTFTRGAVMKRLVETICTNQQVSLDALKAMSRDINKSEDIEYLEYLCNKCIVLIVEGKLEVNQVCQAAQSFYNLGKIGAQYLEKIWVGVTNESEVLNAEQITNIVGVLPLVSDSRIILYNYAERKSVPVWHTFKPEHVGKILSVMVKLNINSFCMLSILSRWTNVNIHNVTEEDLRWIVYSFLCLNFTDMNIQSALTRYMKIKNTNINSSNLVGVIMDYCVKVKYRSSELLNSAANYFDKNSTRLSTPQVYSIFRSFGILNYVPPNASTFFNALEYHLDNSFEEFPPDIIIDMLLCCVYLKNYPLKYVQKLFNPHFLDKMSLLEKPELRKTCTKLKVLDNAMFMDDPEYTSPILPRDYTSKNFSHDGRIMRCIQNIQTILLEIAGHSERILFRSGLHGFPGVDMYVIDCVLDMTGKINLPYFKWSKQTYAILIHLPEHYTICEQTLIGPQEMRVRHIKHASFKVVSLSLNILNKYRMYPDKTKTYIQEQIAKAST